MLMMSYVDSDVIQLLGNSSYNNTEANVGYNQAAHSKTESSGICICTRFSLSAKRITGHYRSQSPDESLRMRGINLSLYFAHA